MALSVVLFTTETPVEKILVITVSEKDITSVSSKTSSIPSQVSTSTGSRIRLFMRGSWTSFLLSLFRTFPSSLHWVTQVPPTPTTSRTGLDNTGNKKYDLQGCLKNLWTFPAQCSGVGPGRW